MVQDGCLWGQRSRFSWSDDVEEESDSGSGRVNALVRKGLSWNHLGRKTIPTYTFTKTKNKMHKLESFISHFL